MSNDRVFIKSGVNKKDIVIAFDLTNKEVYKNLMAEVERKNDYDNIEKLKQKEKPYKIFVIKYHLTNSDKYNTLHIQEKEETYMYDIEYDEYKRCSYTIGGKMINRYMTYHDLIDDTHNSIEKVVQKIKELERNIMIK